MAKGSVAKEAVIKKIASAFGENYIGEFDRKQYVWANDGGEQVQIAISLTCPKVPIEVDKNISTSSGDWDFTDDSPNTTVAVSNVAPAEITEEEKENLVKLMEKLGL